MELLFITSTRIGDAVLSTGLLDHLIATETAAGRPVPRVTVAVGAPAAPLFAGVPGLVRVLPIVKRPRAGHWRDLWRATIGTRWDLVVDLRGSAIAWLLRARHRRVLSRHEDGRHKLYELARTLDLDPPPAPRIWTRPEDHAAALAAFPEGSQPILALAPAANWVGKQWPAERFAELVGRLAGPGGAMAGARVAVIAAPHERPQAEPALAAARAAGLEAPDIIGSLPLLGVQALLERSALFIGNDSGLMHMAAAAGAPTLGLFGPTPDALYGPWGPHAVAVRTPETYDRLAAERPTSPADRCYMTGLATDTVERAAVALLDRVARSGRIPA
ncbi:glycosyltransferase family 9 protein [Tistrella mobilis]|uniref:Glycosyl transferase n=1 Tax=Tistrella mobilis TaxID=171437 RepID=A0A162KI11_9PROT|nr:glycosyltransferase family 9 protein [Tistrella mobilis]KYO51332.1 hypothetical protein AUP44_09245 [Tistrella mobilis]